MEEKKEIKRPRIETDCFVAAWVKAANEGGTQADVAEALGCSVAGALSKWKRLRDGGAILPELPAGSRKAKVDIDRINSYVKANLVSAK